MANALKTPDDLYETDFYAWTQDQAAKLRARALTDNLRDIDWDNAAEEIESLGGRERREIRSRLAVLLKHLLKWRYQSQRRSDSWETTISEQRLHLSESLNDSPSLGRFPQEVLTWAYGWAVRDAAREARLRDETFPDTCPFTVEEILDPAFYPDAP